MSRPRSGSRRCSRDPAHALPLLASQRALTPAGPLLLPGSQTFALMQNVTESMGDRWGVLLPANSGRRFSRDPQSHLDGASRKLVTSNWSPGKATANLDGVSPAEGVK